MESSRFDHLARGVRAPQPRRTVTALLVSAFLAPTLANQDSAAKRKKKKKKCAKRCASGCCTNQNGNCIKLAQQSTTRCGTGGQICQSTGCPCSATDPCPTGQCCTSQRTCGACLVFATSNEFTGNLGGLTGADALCQNSATIAGLPGTYLAWLSDATSSPSTRFTQATVPYTLVDGSVVANNFTDLTSGTLNHAIDLTETGGNGANVVGVGWTNTLTTGAVEAVTPLGSCANWTTNAGSQVGNVGNLNRIDATWTDSLDVNCIFALPLYCFQQR